MSKDELQPLIDCMNDEERKYLNFVYTKLKQAEEKFNNVYELYRNVESELNANYSALDVWLTYIKNKYQEVQNVCRTQEEQQ